jgi:CP family cyanate transporter-like MFS transporter
LADRWGWRGALAVWAGPALLALLAWRPGRDGGRPDRTEVRMPVRSPLAWAVVAYFTLGTIGFFACLAWVAPSFVAAGADEALGGVALAVLTAGNVAGGLLGPVVAGRLADPRPVLVAAAGLAAVGIAGLAVLPDAGSGAALLAPALAGFGLGAGFGLSLLLLADTAAGTAASRGLSALAFLVAFTAAAPFPTVLGVLQAGSGSFAPGWWLIAGAVAAAALVVPWLGPRSRGAVR